MPGTDYIMEKDDFGIFVVFVDFLVIITLICFIYILDARQNEYIAQFNDDTIMMSDYTIRVKNLPSDQKYQDKEELLRAHLWLHFE